MYKLEKDHDCNQCGAKPGERHIGSVQDGYLWYDDLARCRYTGKQLIACGGGEEYDDDDNIVFVKSDHPPCEPDVWDGQYPGTKECRRLKMYTSHSLWGVGEDLNGYYGLAAMNGSWSVKEERYIIPEYALESYFARKAKR